jgi:hypothetical protein
MGSVAVANIAYEKKLICRFTVDDWRTISEVEAEFSYSIPSASNTSLQYDRFIFTINHTDFTELENKTLSFCLRYEVNDEIFWDNNDQADFHVTFRRRRQHRRRLTTYANLSSLVDLDINNYSDTTTYRRLPTLASRYDFDISLTDAVRASKEADEHGSFEPHVDKPDTLGEKSTTTTSPPTEALIEDIGDRVSLAHSMNSPTLLSDEPDAIMSNTNGCNVDILSFSQSGTRLSHVPQHLMVRLIISPARRWHDSSYASLAINLLSSSQINITQRLQTSSRQWHVYNQV